MGRACVAAVKGRTCVEGEPATDMERACVEGDLAVVEGRGSLPPVDIRAVGRTDTWEEDWGAACTGGLVEASNVMVKACSRGSTGEN